MKISLQTIKQAESFLWKAAGVLAVLWAVAWAAGIK